MSPTLSVRSRLIRSASACKTSSTRKRRSRWIPGNSKAETCCSSAVAVLHPHPSLRLHLESRQLAARHHGYCHPQIERLQHRRLDPFRQSVHAGAIRSRFHHNLDLRERLSGMYLHPVLRDRPAFFSFLVGRPPKTVHTAHHHHIVRPPGYPAI